MFVIACRHRRGELGPGHVEFHMVTPLLLPSVLHCVSLSHRSCTPRPFATFLRPAH